LRASRLRCEPERFGMWERFYRDGSRAMHFRGGTAATELPTPSLAFAATQHNRNVRVAKNRLRALQKHC